MELVPFRHYTNFEANRIGKEKFRDCLKHVRDNVLPNVRESAADMVSKIYTGTFSNFSRTHNMRDLRHVPKSYDDFTGY